MFEVGEWRMSFSPRQQSHRDAITTLTAVLRDADCGVPPDEELLVVTRYGAEERQAGERRLRSTGWWMRCVRSLPGSSPAAPPENPAQPWLRSVGLAVSAGTLSSSTADAIRTGLGTPSDSVPSSALATAAEHLCVMATTLDADRLAILARQLRDEIDEAGITDPGTSTPDRPQPAIGSTG
jgi:hypothetical protein